MSRAVVVGGGVGGASAALTLADAGLDVVLVERSPHLGGLVVSLDVGGTPIERYYHHIFPHEHEIISLINDMGLGDKLDWLPSSVGMLIDGRLWPFTSPVDLLRFRPLRFVDRVHTGIGALRSGRWKDWESLDTVYAKDWLTSLTGRRGMEVIWEPLLRAKFGTAADHVPAAWMFGRFQQRAAARQGGSEKLGYLRGGFRQLFDVLEAELPRRGIDVRLGTAVSGVSVTDGRVVAVETAGGSIDASAVIYAGTLPGLAPLLAPEHVDPRWTEIGSMGAMAVVVELRRQITDTYWVNVCDPRLPLTAYIEHTNLLPPSDYGGRHLAYLARYFTQDDPVASVDVEEEAWRWVDVLADGGLPGFSRDDVVAIHPSRTRYAAPLVLTGHLGRIPPVRSHITGLYVATTAQIYPQDRGMSEGARLGAEAAHHVLSDLELDRSPTADPMWTCPVCGGHSYTVRYAVSGSGTEDGVNAEAFRPSSEQFGRPSGSVVACDRCGHGTLDAYPQPEAVSSAYSDAADPVSLREEKGHAVMALRAVHAIEAAAARSNTATFVPGRFVDIGCWTGSLLLGAKLRGWDVVGVEPSGWASSVARERGLDVRTAGLEDHGLEAGSFRAVAMCDVLEHLEDPASAVDEVHRLLEPGGVFYLTVPNAGSRWARTMGRRWWGVLPMHLQYFSRSSMEQLLGAHGFRVAAVRTHPKVFTTRYYAERVAGYSPGIGRIGVGALRATGLADRLIAPDFGDRLEVVAISR